MSQPPSLVTTVTGPAIEPVTVAEVKAYARIDGSDDDAHIAGWIETARTAAESYTKRSFITRTLKLSMDNAGCGRSEWNPGYYQLPVNYFDGYLPSKLELPQGPVIGVTSVTTYDTLNDPTLYESTRYSVFGDRIVLNSGETWPSGLRSTNATEIIYTAGHGPAATDVPRPIRTAIIMHAAQMYDGQCGCEMSDACRMLLQPYRVMGDSRG